VLLGLQSLTSWPCPFLLEAASHKDQKYKSSFCPQSPLALGQLIPWIGVLGKWPRALALVLVWLSVCRLCAAGVRFRVCRGKEEGMEVGRNNNMVVCCAFLLRPCKEKTSISSSFNFLFGWLVGDLILPMWYLLGGYGLALLSSNCVGDLPMVLDS